MSQSETIPHPSNSQDGLSSLPESLDAVIDAAIAENRIAGAVVLVSRDGEIIYARAAGFADREAGNPMEIDTLFRLSSVSMATDHTPGMELGPWPGRGFGLGFTVLRDPATAGLPESPGTWRLGGAYGHSWFVDRAKGLSVVAFTNAGLEGQSPGGRFPDDITRAIYQQSIDE